MKFKFQSQAYVKGNPIWVILKILFYLITGFMTLMLLFAILGRSYINFFLALAVLPLGIALFFRSRAKKHFVKSVIELELKDYEMQWTFRTWTGVTTKICISWPTGISPR